MLQKQILQFLQDYSDSTAKNYGSDLRNFKKYLDEKGIKDFIKIGPDIISGYFSDMENKGCSVSVQQGRYSVLNSFCKFLKELKVVEKNWLAGIRYPTGKKTRKIKIGVEFDEYKKLLAASESEENSQKWKLIIGFLYNLKAKSEELKKLKRKDFNLDFDERIVSVTIKGRERFIYDPSIIKILKKWISRHNIESGNLIFRNYPKTKRMCDGMERLCKRAQIGRTIKVSNFKNVKDTDLMELLLNNIRSEKKVKVRKPIVKPKESRERELQSKIEQYVKETSSWIKRYEQIGFPNEETTKFRHIAPFLDLLGWDTKGEEVYWEYPVIKRKDYADAALIIDNKPKILMEAKQLSQGFTERIITEDLNRKLLIKNVAWGILFNGKEIQVYHKEQIDEENKPWLFFKTSLDSFEKDYEKLYLLSREAVASGKLSKKGEQEYKRNKGS